jgi:hypothetical protein
MGPPVLTWSDAAKVIAAATAARAKSSLMATPLLLYGNLDVVAHGVCDAHHKKSLFSQSNQPGSASERLMQPRAPFRRGSLTCPRRPAPRGRRGPLQTWKTFLRNQSEGIASIDLFVVPTIAFEQLFAFLVLGHGRRQLLWIAVTRNPTAEWLARQITEAFPWERAPKYLIRDNDRAFGVAFRARVRAMGIRDRPISFRSPWQNGYVERSPPHSARESRAGNPTN